MKIDPHTGEILQKKIPFLRTEFNYDVDQASAESALHCLEPSLAQQNSKDECDINEIVRRFGVTGVLPQNMNPPQYGDFTEITDYQSALHAVRDAESRFMDMPADLRARFQNDPGELINFLHNENNRTEAQTLGLIPPDLQTAPTLEQPTPSTPTTS